MSTALPSEPSQPKQRGRFVCPALLVCSVSVFSTLVLYARNTDMIALRYVLPFFAAYLALGWAAYAVSFLLLRSAGKSALLSAWLMAIFMNFGLADRLMHSLRYSWPAYILCGLCCVLVSVGVFFLLRRLKPENASVLCAAFALVFTLLVVFNAAVCAVHAVQSRDRDRADYQTPSADQLLAAAQNARPEALPNFYLLLFDEYAGFDELTDYYQFDNGDFYSYLTDKGFNVSTSSTNEMVDTMYILSDLLNLEYLHPEGYNEARLRRQIENGVLFDMMKALGYDLYDTEGDALTRLKNPIPKLHGVSVPTTQTGETYIKVFMNNTAAFFLYDNVERALLQQRTNHPDSVNLIMDYYATAQFPKSGAFYFGYILSPHGAFFFDADGNRIDTVDDPYGNFNWTDKSVYLGQLQYTTKRIRGAVDNILAQDPDAIVVVMSDHGARNHDVYGNADVTMDQALDILMAVYAGGRQLPELEGLSGVNTLRTLLNETYGMELPLLDFWPAGHPWAQSGKDSGQPSGQPSGHPSGQPAGGGSKPET